MKQKIFLLLSSVFVLSACSTPPLTDDQQCQKFGAVPGSNAYIDCMSKLANRDAVVERKAREAQEAADEQRKKDEDDAQRQQQIDQSIQQMQQSDEQILQQINDQTQQQMQQQNQNMMNCGSTMC